MTDTITIPHMEKRQALAEMEAEHKTLRQRHIDEITALNDKYDAMGVYSIEARWLGHSASSGFERCAKSGVVLLDVDEVVNDDETEEVDLRAALGLPPRETTDSEEPDADDDSGLAENAA